MVIAWGGERGGELDEDEDKSDEMLITPWGESEEGEGSRLILIGAPEGFAGQPMPRLSGERACAQVGD